MTRRKEEYDPLPHEALYPKVHTLGEVSVHLQRALEALGLDVANDPHLRDTPRRWGDWLAGQFTKKEFRFTKFPAEGTDQLVALGPIPFSSVCPHHVLPYYGQAWVAYLPGRFLAGLSKIPRTVERASKGLKVQEHLTAEVVDTICDHVYPRFAMCVTKARHTCMEQRGPKSHGTETTCSAIRPKSRQRDETLKQEAFRLWGMP